MGSSIRRGLLVALLLAGGGLAEAQYVGYWPPASSDPVTCDAAHARAYYYNTATSRFKICNGTAWGNVSTAAGGGSESDSVVEKSIALTSDQPNPAASTVTAAWITASSIVVCGVKGTTADGLTPETISVANLGITTENYVASTSFDIRIENWYGLEGTVRIHCIGR